MRLQTPSSSQTPVGVAAAAQAWLDWLAAMGADDPLPSRAGPAEPEAASRSAEAMPPSVAPPTVPPPARRAPGSIGVSGEREGILAAERLARSCHSLADVQAALESFEGCALKTTATRLCFADGHPHARVMLIGEAPGTEEDRQGKPFVGPSGKLLDRMLATVALDRECVWITNVIFWRPPGNRSPTAGEIAVCQPFLERQIELLRPAVLVFVGGIAARSLLGVADGVTRLRGRRFTYSRPEIEPIPALVMFHPAYLLRQPLQKRYAWRDLLTLQSWLAPAGSESAARAEEIH
jgi:DNA polymerase